MFARIVMFIFIVSFVSCASKHTGPIDHSGHNTQTEKFLRHQR
jgi:hypothetical protein